MSERLRRAAEAVFEYAEKIQTPEYAHDIALTALAAADAVMFSDEAVERAVDNVLRHQMYARGECMAGDKVGTDPVDIARHIVRAVVAALKGGGGE
jgi:hypothetical protein